MALKAEMDLLLDLHKAEKETLAHNEELFNIFEGDLLTYLLEDLADSMSENSYLQAKDRAAPINLLKRLVDKLSKIYSKPPVRKVANGTDVDQALLSEFEKALSINTIMGAADGANGFFNLFKNTFVEPYLDRGRPKLRVLPSNRFLVYSNDPVNPMRPTHLLKIMGEYLDLKGDTRTMYYAYTDDEFLIFNDKREVLTEQMARLDNAEGINHYGKIPGVYLSRSKYSLIPTIDTDTLTMTKLIPIQLTDVNFAMKFMCFSLIYTIDCNQTGFKVGPNVILDIKSDGKSDKPPQIGTIKPDVDSDKALALIKSQLALWMQSRNIKPGAMGDLTLENAASGIAKMIDEMDTSEDRTSQVPYFRDAEADLWDLVINHMHPRWSDLADIDYDFRGRTFSKGIQVDTIFAEQRPILDSSKAIADQKTLMELGLQTEEGALKELYPDWTDVQIKERLKQVKAARAAKQLDMAKSEEHVPGQMVDEEAEMNAGAIA